MVRRTLKTIGRIGAAVALGLAGCLLLLSLAPLLASRNPTKVSFLGKYAPLIVLTASMEPTYRVGSILFVEKSAPEDIRVGDAITFDSPRTDPLRPIGLTTHRVTSVDSASGALAFHTKGDANSTGDMWVVPADTVVGRGAFAIPYLGYTSAFVRSKLGFISLVLLPAALIVLLELTSATRTVRGGVRENDDPPTLAGSLAEESR